ncbi:MAG: epoxyqueuosine reductase QueH [Deltaproteobacteria bacterium]|nr:epoxyqueuosine reductase QueH [Deltaproteobacteria bacterium]
MTVPEGAEGRERGGPGERAPDDARANGRGPESVRDAARAPESLLLHACCAPCSVYTLKALYRSFPKVRILLWYFNPNIHPAAEYRRRRDALAYIHARRGAFLPPGAALSLDVSAPYRPDEFLAAAAASPRRPERCAVCYGIRIAAAARKARQAGCEAFSTTLLYSRKQGHELIRDAGEAAAGAGGPAFLYQDFRTGWKEGRELSLKLDVYRQNYCGCLYGETDN